MTGPVRSSLVVRLIEVVTGLGAMVDTPALLQRICDSAQDLLSAYVVGVVVREGDELVIVAAAGPHPELLGRSFPLEGSAVGELVRTGQRSLVADGSTFAHLNDELFEGEPMPLAVALTHADIAGVAALYVLRAQTMIPDEIEVLELLAAHAGAALRTAELFSAAVAEHQEKEAVIEAMADGVAVLDEHRIVRSWNRSLARMTARGGLEAVGHPVPFPLPPLGELLEHQLPEGRWIEVAIAPVGDLPALVVSVRDISRAKELESAKDLFLAAASHELRTPLTVLRGFAETLLRHWDVLSDERRRDLVDTILVRTSGMGRLVEQLLLGSRAGVALEVQICEFDLAAAVRAAASASEGSSSHHPIVVHAGPELLAVGDPSAVGAVIDQLVENAVKYSPRGGRIEVTVRADGPDAVVEVADRGVGIATEDLTRVFDRFVRSAAREADLPSAGGVGLGLWIVRRYVEAQGGRVSALRRPGGGTVIEVRLGRPATS